jgi:photosystem II stability/assembly factor-like uncharacterized protein
MAKLRLMIIQRLKNPMRRINAFTFGLISTVALLLSLLSVTNSSASVQTWRVVSIPGDHDAIIGVSCYSAVNCVGVSEFSGQISISNTSGNTWTEIHPKNLGGFAFTSIKCLSNKFCLATGQIGSLPSIGAAIYSSHNGGINWKFSLKVPVRHSSKFQLNDANCPTKNICLVSGTTGAKGVLYRTINSGKSWKSVVLPKQPPNGSIQAIACPSSTVCYTVQGSEALVYKSVDSGLSWKTLNVPNNFNFYSSEKDTPTGLDAISCGSENFCVAGGYIAHPKLQGTTQPIKWVTTNGGISWYFSNSFASTGAKSTFAVNVHGISCSTSHDCTIGLSYGQLYATSDAGRSWLRDRNIPSPNNNVLSLNCTSAAHCIATVISIFPQKSFTSGEIWVRSK